MNSEACLFLSSSPQQTAAPQSAPDDQSINAVGTKDKKNKRKILQLAKKNRDQARPTAPVRRPKKKDDSIIPVDDVQNTDDVKGKNKSVTPQTLESRQVTGVDVLKTCDPHDGPKPSQDPDSSSDMTTQDIEQASTIITSLKPEEDKNNASEPEQDVPLVEKMQSVSLIKKIGISLRGKKLPLRKPGKVDSAKGFVEPCVPNKKQEHTDVVENLMESKLDGNTSIETTGLAISHKLNNAAEVKEHPLPVPRPRSRKRFSGSFPDDLPAIEATPQDIQGEIVQTKYSKDISTMDDSKTSVTLGDQSSTCAKDIPYVKLRSKKDLSSLQPVPKPRVKKRFSAQFPDEIAKSEVVTDGKLFEAQQQDEQLILPVPLPRDKKKHLSGTFSDSTTQPDSTCLTDSELSLMDNASHTSKGASEGPASLESSVISEGGFVTVPREDDVASELEFLQTACVEDTEEAIDEMIQTWTFTDKHGVMVSITDSKATEAVLEDTKGSRSVSTVSSAQDDWQHVEDNTNNEPMDINSREEVKIEDLDCGFVSVDVEAGCVEEER